MKIGLIMFLLLLFSGIGQSEISEKEAVDRVRRIPASSIDAELSGSPFGNWFEQIVGPKAGVIWQLAECGEYSDQTDGKQRDLNACVEADAVLEDDLKVVVAINVGTFRKGMIGRPVLYLAIIECDNQLHDVRRLRDLSSTLQSLRRGSPVKAPLVLPSVSVRPLVI
ncbi:MAG: hypothetical protein J2P41_06745, partial [Blastocatellia bacterium]|nr:hypothetical protein [Blastocatellia bacterium]